ncbi:hypothetical protein Bbelb_438870 [Branchiostoma belcheri]|nr:hypothetical protein Bbelb_438870 [Branchiostoma belcheri]
MKRLPAVSGRLGDGGGRGFDRLPMPEQKAPHPDLHPRNRTSPSPTTPIYISESYQVIPDLVVRERWVIIPGTSAALTGRALMPGGRVDKEMIIRAFFNRTVGVLPTALPDLRTRSDISSHQCASGSRYKGTLLPLELHSPRQGNVQEYVMRSHRGRKTEIIKMNIIGAYFLLQPSRYYSTERPLSLLPSLRRFCAVIKTGGAGPGNRVREAAASPVFSGRENCECSAAGRRYGTQPSVTQEVLRGLHVASCGTEVSKQPSRDNANIAVGKER